MAELREMTKCIRELGYAALRNDPRRSQFDRYKPKTKPKPKPAPAVEPPPETAEASK